MSNTPKSTSPVPKILLPIAILSSIGAVWSYFHTKAFVEQAVNTEGKVVEMIRMDYPDPDNPTFTPVFIFEDKFSKQHKISSRTSTYPPAYEVGDKV